MVLLYHRVSSGSTSQWRLAVSPRRFAEHMRLLAQEFRPLALAELVEGARSRSLPRGAVAVTFDDGYADNLTEALPVLEQVGVPATVFVASGFVSAHRPFWWDEIGQLLSGDSGRASELQDRLRRSGAEEVERSLAALRAQAGLDGPADTGHARPLTVEELARLDSSDLIEIGSHTRSHVSLPALAAADAAREAAGGRDDVAEWLGRPPTGFSYPFGDHGPRGRRVAHAVGFSYAAGTARGIVNRVTDRLELPRLWVDDEPPEWLELQLGGLLDRRPA